MQGAFCRKCPKTHQSSAPGLQKCLAFPWELRNLAFTTKSLILLSCTLPIYQVPSTERVRTIPLGSSEQAACNIVQSGLARAEAAKPNKILVISMHVNLKVQTAYCCMAPYNNLYVCSNMCAGIHMASMLTCMGAKFTLTLVSNICTLETGQIAAFAVYCSYISMCSLASHSLAA